MKEFIEKLIARLVEEVNLYYDGVDIGVRRVTEIVNQLAEETIHESSSKSENVIESSSGWIPCSGCKDCKHKECEHYGKV